MFHHAPGHSIQNKFGTIVSSTVRRCEFRTSVSYGNPDALSLGVSPRDGFLVLVLTTEIDPSASERDTPADDLTNHPEPRRQYVYTKERLLKVKK